MTWSRPNFASAKEQSEIINAFSKALDVLIANGSVTKEEAYNTLKELDVLELEKSYEEHKKVIDVEEQEREKKNKEANNAGSGEAGDEGADGTGEDDDEGSEE